VKTTSEGHLSDPYARYKAQLSAFRRDSPAAALNGGLGRTSNVTSGTTTTATSGLWTLSVNGTERQPTSGAVTPSIQTSRTPALSQTSAAGTTSSVTSQQSSSVTSGGVVCSPSISTSSVLGPAPSTSYSVPVTTSSSNSAARLSAQNAVSSNIARRQLAFSTPDDVSRQQLPWRRDQQPSSVANDDSGLTQPGNTASTIRRSVLNFYLY